MQRANWTSLGIIVTLLACMVHRLASSKRDTKYASAASCRHMMVLPWKRMSVLPTSWAISWTSCEKGSFRIRSSVLFWYHQISWRATVPGQYLLGFLTFPAFRNSFRGALASNGRTELPSGRLLSQSRWPSLHSHLGQLLGWQQWWWLTHFHKPIHLLNPPYHLLQCLCHLPHGWGAFGWGGVVHRRGGCFFSPSSFLACLASCLCLLLSSLLLSSCLASLTRWAHSFLVHNTILPSLSFLGVVFVLAILFEKWREKVVAKENNYQEVQFEKQRKKQKVYIKIKNYMIIAFSWDFTQWPFWILKWGEVTFSCQIPCGSYQLLVKK